MIEIPQLVDFFMLLGKLKKVKRYEDGNNGFHRDSTADHTYRLIFIVVALIEKFKLAVDLLRAIKMAILHDLLEVVDGDLPARVARKNPKLKKQKHMKEVIALELICQEAPPSIREEVRELIMAYRDGTDPEAIIVKSCDKTESTLHIIENSTRDMVGDGFFPIYGRAEILKAIGVFPQVRPYFEEINRRARCEVEKHGCQWKKKYNL